MYAVIGIGRGEGDKMTAWDIFCLITLSGYVVVVLIISSLIGRMPPNLRDRHMCNRVTADKGLYALRR